MLSSGAHPLPHERWTMLNHRLLYQRYGDPASVLQRQSVPLTTRENSLLRVRMRFAPVNPSDLIPVTGAYRHRTTLPAVAGYEGLGTVEQVPPSHAALLGQRVLPLRGDGTWQTYLDIAPDWLIPVPDAIPDSLAARGYINPLTAWLMLTRWPVAGKHVVLTAASSSCAALLGQWALRMGAASVTGILRSPEHAPRLIGWGMMPLLADNLTEIRNACRRADLVFDAVGGALATAILHFLPPAATLISYGLLSGAPITFSHGTARVAKFHLREALPGLSIEAWQHAFRQLWQLLPTTALPEVQIVPYREWREALRLCGGKYKVVLDFRDAE